MSRLSYVVVSTPRSGTRYTARLLTAAGLQCGHEQAFGFKSNWNAAGWRLERKDREGVWGDSSWLAAPYLEHIPEDVVVIYQMRNPLDTIRSIIRQNLTTEPYVQPGQFAWEQAGLKGDLSPEQAAVRFWVAWHRMIQQKLKGRENVYRVRLEDWSETTVTLLAWQIAKRNEALKGPLPLDSLDAALENKRENHRQSQAERSHVPRGGWPLPEMSWVVDLLYRFDEFERL